MPRNITKLKDALKYIKNNKSIMTVDEMEKMNEIKYSNENKKASSKEEKLYNKILSNPNISDIDKKHLKRNTKEGTKLDMDDLKAFEKNALMMNEDWSDEEKPKKKKAQKTGNIMKARSDLKKKDDKYEITTDMNVRKGLGPKAKKALKESVNKALDKEFKGGRIILDYSSDEEPIKRKRGRPKKGKGLGHSKVAAGNQVSIDDIGLEFNDIIPQTVKHKKQSNVDLFELRQDMNSRNFMRDTKGNPGKMQRNRLYRINK